MPDIVLKNKNGESVTYEGIETVTFDTPTEERGATFIHGTPLENVPIELDLVDGNQTVAVPDGYFVKSAVIQKPDGLVAENIKLGVDIAGVVGEMVGAGIEGDVDLDFSEGNQVVTPPENTLYSQVTINQPETLIADNIKSGVEVAGITGSFIGNEQEIEVDLAMADGSQIFTPDKGCLFSSVTVKKPETLLPENIVNGIDIGGVVGTYTGGKVILDEWFKYLSCYIDPDTETIMVEKVLYDKIYADTGNYDVTIPDTLLGYPVIIAT